MVSILLKVKYPFPWMLYGLIKFDINYVFCIMISCLVTQSLYLWLLLVNWLMPNRCLVFTVELSLSVQWCCPSSQHIEFHLVCASAANLTPISHLCIDPNYVASIVTDRQPFINQATSLLMHFISVLPFSSSFFFQSKIEWDLMKTPNSIWFLANFVSTQVEFWWVIT